MNSWEDWLNEGMAEYCALLSLRELAGPDEYAARIARKRQDAQGTPPLVGFDRSDGDKSDAVLYAKAPVLLSDLTDRIGFDGFLAVARRLQDATVVGTEAFLRALEAVGGSSERRRFREELSRVGTAPSG